MKSDTNKNDESKSKFEKSSKQIVYEEKSPPGQQGVEGKLSWKDSGRNLKETGRTLSLSEFKNNLSLGSKNSQTERGRKTDLQEADSKANLSETGSKANPSEIGSEANPPESGSKTNPPESGSKTNPPESGRKVSLGMITKRLSRSCSTRIGLNPVENEEGVSKLKERSIKLKQDAIENLSSADKIDPQNQDCA